MKKPIVNSNLEPLKIKNSEKLFYKYLSEDLSGMCLFKIAPETGLYFDLAYVNDNNAVLFKFIDTNEDTFEIIGTEIIEVIQEEKQVVDNYLISKFGITINYFFVMPFIDLQKFDISEKSIIDKTRFENLINKDEQLSNLMSNCEGKEEELIFQLGKEYMVFNDRLNYENWNINVNYNNQAIKAIYMENEQIEKINALKYGETVIEGSTGTGKTALLLAKAIKLARLFPNEKFLYLTFDKQNSIETKKLLNYFYKDIKNIRIINYHQFILKLGAKFNLRLNKRSKQNFNTEFKKVFNKVSEMYQNKRYYKGIFVDESENFDQADMVFLKSICQKDKSFLMVSYDWPKRLSPIENEDKFKVSKTEVSYILTTSNFRASENIGYHNKNFQNNVNTFSLLELELLSDYFLPFDIKRKVEGKLEIVEYKESAEALDFITEIIKSYQNNNCDLSDIAIIYPYNTKTIKGNQIIDSKNLIKEALSYENIPSTYASDDSSNYQKTIGVTLSNIFNFNNLQKKVIILCQLETLYDLGSKNEQMETQKILNIIYTATGRATEDLYILIKESENRPSVIDLLSQK